MAGSVPRIENPSLFSYPDVLIGDPEGLPEKKHSLAAWLTQHPSVDPLIMMNQHDQTSWLIIMINPHVHHVPYVPQKAKKNDESYGTPISVWPTRPTPQSRDNFQGKETKWKTRSKHDASQVVKLMWSVSSGTIQGPRKGTLRWNCAPLFGTPKCHHRRSLPWIARLGFAGIQ